MNPGGDRPPRRLTDRAEKLAELRPAWCIAQQQAQELLGDDAARSIKHLVDRMFAEQHATE